MSEHSNRIAIAAIKRVFAKGADAYNRRDLDGYLATYADGEDVRWVSGGRMIIGKAAIKAALEPRFADGAAMGILTVEHLQIEIQTPTDALVFGAYRLMLYQTVAVGVFTVHLQRLGRWLIVSDHASALSRQSETPTPIIRPVP